MSCINILRVYMHVCVQYCMSLLNTAPDSFDRRRNDPGHSTLL